MKKPIFFLFLLFTAVQELPAQLNANEDGITFRFSGAPRLVAEILGIGRETIVVLDNPTPFFLEASILGKSFNIDPNNLIYDCWRVGFQYSQLPVAAKVFGDKARKHQIGIAIMNDVLRIEKRNSAIWSVSVNDIHFFDESYRSKNYLSNDLPPEPENIRRVNIPTIEFELTTVVQFVNLTSAEVLVTEAGPMRSDLAKCGVYASTYSSIVKIRKQKIAPFGFALFETHLPTYGQYSQSVMYWVGDGDESKIVNVGPFPNWGPGAVQYIVR